jgi:hypothetical protein
MRNSENLHQRALGVIRQHKRHDRADLLKAIFDVRHDAMPGDETLLYRLLDESGDDGVVASALDALFEVFGQETRLTPLIQKLAWGDNRDCGEMPIQCLAICLLARCANSSPELLLQIRAIGENQEMAECPRKEAWQQLASVFGVDWFRDWTAEMIMDPTSDKSEQIRIRIRAAMDSQTQNRNYDRGSSC